MMKKNNWIAFCLCLCYFSSRAQIYEDYLGAGHNQGISISSSGTESGFFPGATIDGVGIDSASMKIQASRFLAQATLGANRALIDEVAQKGFEAWIDEQIQEPITYTTPALENALAQAVELCEETIDPNEEFDCDNLGADYGFSFNMGWWQATMIAKDQLRHRVAFALSEILVISGISQLEERYGLILADYYDMLLRNAFNNYEQLLLDLTLHPAMGAYLSHFNNPKTNIEENTRPDENFAREIMQLFSIGLFELNMDGSPKTFQDGSLIPSYDNDDIKEFAKVFTGLGDGDPNGEFGTPPLSYAVNFFVPMRMYEEQHEPGEKRLLNNFVIPTGQTGIEDIQMAVKHLVDHPNTAPFICYRLIQRLVKSNPSPAYVARVSMVFKDNGQGVRGDLAAVVKAILLDPEARNCEWLEDFENGKLREPLLRYTHAMRAINASNERDEYFNLPYDFLFETRQLAMFAPSVFNFFLPEYQPNGPIAQAGLFGPEFQIHNTSTSIGYINMVDQWTFVDLLMETAGPYEVLELEIPDDVKVSFNYSPYQTYTNNEVILDELSLLLTHDQLSEGTRQIILQAMNEAGINSQDRIRIAIYLILIAADYNVTR